jgi:hypothetical protein
MDELLTRRNTLLRLAGLVGAGLGIEALKPGDGPAGVASGAVRCVLTPEQTEGPFYLENEKVRRNITDGRRGTPLTLRATVVDASSCKPIKGAAVHVGGNVVHTGQLYFPDSLTDKVFRKTPYKSRPGRTTRNSNDFVFANGGKNSMVSVRADGAGGYVASITMGVVRA